MTRTFRKYECLSFNGIKRNILISWMDRKCKSCGKFMYRYSKGDLCFKCAEIINCQVGIEIRCYSKKSLRKALYPIKMSRLLESSLGSSYYR